MKTCLAVAAVAAVLMVLLPVGGCVSKAEYEQVRVQCRRAHEELGKAQEALKAAEAEKAALQARIDEANAIIKAKLAEIDLLDKKNQALQRSYDELQALYKGSQGPLPPPGPIVLLPPQLDAALQEWARNNPDLVEYLPEFGMVKFKADLTFEKGSDDVSPSADEALRKMVEILNDAAATKFNVYVAGHTDDIPIEKPDTRRRHPDNWYLSVHRSVAVEKVMVNGGLDPRRIGAMGFGEYHPIEINMPNKQGNAKNRRVEIWIVPPDRFLTQSVQAGQPGQPAQPVEAGGS